MNKLLELAERCEAATGPDRELDFAIYAQLCGKDTSHIKTSQRYLYGEPYTSSLDAAMTLVPTGFEDWQIADLLARAVNCWFNTHRETNGQANPSRLAAFVCAAALRSRSEQETPK